MTTVRIVVQSSTNCNELLRYIDKNIRKINSAGMRIKIIKATKSKMPELRAAGVTRLPAMFPPGAKPIIGRDKIQDVLERNMDGGGMGSNRQAQGMVDSGDPVHDFLMRESFVNVGGKMVPRDGADLDEEGGSQRVMDRYRAARSTRRTASETAAEDDPDERPGRRANITDDDNIEAPAFANAQTPHARRGNGGSLQLPPRQPKKLASEADMDDHILESMLNNM